MYRAAATGPWIMVTARVLSTADAPLKERRRPALSPQVRNLRAGKITSFTRSVSMWLAKLSEASESVARDGSKLSYEHLGCV